MELPEAILADVQRYFDGHHPAWHLARERMKEEWEAPQKEAWQAARAMFPTLKFRDEAGAGAEFVVFHREMMREYKWILAQHGDGVTYSPWKSIPKEVSDVIDDVFVATEGYTAAGEVQVKQLLADPDLDAFGGFVEPAPRAAPNGGRGCMTCPTARSQRSKRKRAYRRNTAWAGRRPRIGTPCSTSSMAG